MNTDLEYIWTPTDNIEKNIDDFFNHYKKGILTIAKKFPEIDTVQGLIEKDLEIIKMYELISKDIVQDMFQTTIGISYDIQKTEYNLHEKFPSLKKCEQK